MRTDSVAVEKFATSSKVDRVRFSPKLLWFVFGLMLAGLEAYTSRHWMNCDGVGYLEVALAYARGDWLNAINTYWSPLYSWIFAAVFTLFPVGVSTEFPLAHSVNFACFLFTFWTFHRFWSELRRSALNDLENEALPQLAPRLYEAVGYSLFLYLFVPLVGAMTPDLLSGGFVFLISREMLIWKRSTSISTTRALFLGALIAFAFFAKAILLYFGIASLGCVLLDKTSQKRIRSVVVSSAMTALLLLPWLAALHWRTGEWTLGSTGRLNYVWLVSDPALRYMEPDGPPQGFYPGPRLHPTFQVFSVPTVDLVTYTPWFDPGRMDNSRPHINPRGQATAVMKNLKWLRVWFLVEFGPIVILVLAFVFAGPRRWFRNVLSWSANWVPAIAIFCMYTAVFVRSYRYIAAVTLVLLGAFLASCTEKTFHRKLVGKTVLAALVVFWVTNVPGTILGILKGAPAESHNNVIAARALEQQGIPPLTRFGVIGTGAGAHWAHLVRGSIAAEIWDSGNFWNSSCEERQAIVHSMSQAGAVIIVGAPPSQKLASDWTRLGESGLYMYPVKRSPTLSCGKT